jgi:uncharacterized membrane protein (DUF106 family)
MMERIKRNIPRALIGIAVGAIVGLVLSHVSQALGSQCTIMCRPIIAMSYMGFVGLVVAIK